MDDTFAVFVGTLVDEQTENDIGSSVQNIDEICSDAKVFSVDNFQSEINGCNLVKL
jgi:hypothetical protein